MIKKKKRKLIIFIKTKPRVSFCWECGRKLSEYGFVERKVDGHLRLFHITCSNRLILQLPSYIYPILKLVNIR